jgi:hypothetical protein
LLALKEDDDMRPSILFVCAAALLLAACGGGGGSGPIAPPGSNTPSTSNQMQSQSAIDAANALGDPVKADANFNSTVSGSAAVLRTASENRMLANGTCTNGVEFFSPDKNNDPNSTENQYFYDSACTQLARDVVRIYTVNGSSETVNRTESQYAIGNATAIAVRSSTINYVNGTYGSNGYPVVADGFARSSTSQTNISGSRTIVGDDELVMAAGSGGVNTWCGDSAGYNATGVASLNETFGWQGGVLDGGTRTVNSDGSVTWQSTHAGTVYSGAIGSLSIATGSLNTACPIATPAFSIAGGTSGNNYSIPISTTFLHGELTNLTVANASLANGNTLNVATNSSVSPTSANFITGNVASGGTQIATFAVDCFGDGTLTVSSSGAQYVIQDWHVIH